MDLEHDFENSPLPLNDEILAIADFGDITSSQLDNLSQFPIANNKFTCPQCNKNFTLRPNMLRHQRTLHGDIRFPCPHCSRSFNRKDGLIHHLNCHKRTAEQETLSSTKRPRLDEGINIPQTSSVEQQISGANIPQTSSKGHKISALEDRVRNVILLNDKQYKDLKIFLESKEKDFIDIVLTVLQRYGLKVNCRLICFYQKVSSDGIVVKEICFKSPNQIVLSSDSISALYKGIQDKLLAEADDFMRKESGWTLDRIEALEIRLNKYNPLRGATYIELPQIIKDKKAVINVKNDDNRCFLWAVLSALYPVQDNAYRVSNYEPYVNTLNFTGIEFPVKLQDVKRFEKLNGISINIFGLTASYQVYPLLITKEEKERHIDLLYLTTASTSHYAWIKNLARLLSTQYSRNHRTPFICRRCLQFFTTESILQNHLISCKEREAVRVVMPEDKWISFKNIKHTQSVPFIIYADFECLTRPIESCQPSPNGSYTEAYQKHEPVSFCYYVVSKTGIMKEPYVYRGLDAAKIFLEKMKEEAEEIQRIYKNPLPMNPMTEEELAEFQAATHCYICEDEFTARNYKVKI